MTVNSAGGTTAAVSSRGFGRSVRFFGASDYCIEASGDPLRQARPDGSFVKAFSQRGTRFDYVPVLSLKRVEPLQSNVRAKRITTVSLCLSRA